MGRGGTAIHGKHANLQAGFLLRMVVLAVAAVIGSTWGLVRFYSRVRPPMLVPAAPDAGVWDAGAGTIEAPELIEIPTR